MRLYYNTEKYKSYSKKVAKRAEKRRLKGKRRKKISRRATSRMSKSQREDWREKQGYKIVIRAPVNLSFLDDPESVVKFITKAELAIKQYKSLYFEMKSVKKIDHPSIATLLAVLYMSKKSGVKINGSMPRDEIAKNILVKSGFLYTLFSRNPEAGHKYDIDMDNQLFTLDNYDLSVVGEIEKAVSKRIFGKVKKLGGFYTTIGELMDNTTTHGSGYEEKTERWWLSINYDEFSKKARFTFIDYGVGIFTSLHGKTSEHPVKGILEKAEKFFGVEAVEKHLKRIVEESAGKVYKLPDGRGQGIHGIYQTFKRHEIENLHIITNNAFGDIAKNDYKRLTSHLNGTLYYLEICDKNK